MRIVLTGGPCSGKTTIIDELRKLNYNIVDEPARKLISFFKEHEPENLPTSDNLFFQRFLESKYIKDYVNNNLAIFDRGLPDQIAYRQFFNLIDVDTGTPDVVRKCQKYKYDKVFFFPFWNNIYINDNVRSETKEQALLLETLIKNSYKRFGYELIIVPKVSIAERIKFITENIK